jgi:hypothetical protein
MVTMLIVIASLGMASVTLSLHSTPDTPFPYLELLSAYVKETPR